MRALRQVTARAALQGQEHHPEIRVCEVVTRGRCSASWSEYACHTFAIVARHRWRWRRLPKKGLIEAPDSFAACKPACISRSATTGAAHPRPAGRESNRAPPRPRCASRTVGAPDSDGSISRIVVPAAHGLGA